MEARRSYTTMVGDDESGVALHLTTIQLDSLADKELADRIWSVADMDVISDDLKMLLRPDGESDEAEALRFDVSQPELRSNGYASREEFFLDALLNAVLPVISSDPELEELPSDVLNGLVLQLLQAPVAAEHSSPEIVTGAAAVGVAVAGGLADLMLGIYSTGALSGLGAAALLIGPAGIVVLGTAASVWITVTLLTRSRHSSRAHSTHKHVYA